MEATIFTSSGMITIVQDIDSHQVEPTDMTDLAMSINSALHNNGEQGTAGHNYTQNQSKNIPDSNGFLSTLKEPLVFVSSPHPPNKTPTSWVELAMEGKTISHCVIIGDQPIELMIQDLAWMAQIIKDGVDYIVQGLDYQVWTQTML